MRPKRTDDKYWIGTRNFNHIQYESDLEDYIIDLENETQQLRKHAVSGSALSPVEWLEKEVKKRFGGETFTSVFSAEFEKAKQM